ncbi:hypothetical protein GCM10007891_05310 [Methylophaga thalassica]|uniref:P2 phage tail completion protein R (GpR) n=1 Tax=Methylophaga thalassica TaxID=40223 RepID=A0ABQ5TT10_9GAMM|nr:phage tail protein [Methylophaga thalassica]GLP98677.1 hypothetical protein GCM10007891_05310 [Methylophaga thalassica]
MKKLQAITDYLLNLNMVAAENIDAWAENARFVGVAKDMGNDGMVLFRLHYTAAIVIERFPHQEHPAELLFGHVIAWLMDNDDLREELALDPPETDIDILDNQTADLEINIDFVEDVEIIQDAAGPLRLNGERYRLAPVRIDYALEGEVTT